MTLDHDAARYRDRLKAELDKLIPMLEQARLATGTVELDQTRVGRLSRMDALQQQAMAQGERARLLIRQRRLEAALARITADTFGRCCECHEPLSEQRLAADPAVIFCVDCAEAREVGCGGRSRVPRSTVREAEARGAWPRGGPRPS